MKKILVFTMLVFTMTAWFSIGPGGGLAVAQPQTPAFYEAVSKIRPEGALGQIVGQEFDSNSCRRGASLAHRVYLL